MRVDMQTRAPEIRSIVVVGSSGAGKTTLVNSVRGPEYSDRLIVPRRFITRPPREGDDRSENSYLPHDIFDESVNTGTIWPHWERWFEGGRKEQYGFQEYPSLDFRRRMYSANNAFLRRPSESAFSVLQTSVVVAVVADEDVRAKRLTVRSPDMSDEERAIRLRDDGLDILQNVARLEVIDTTNASPDQGQRAFQAIVQKVLGSTAQSESEPISLGWLDGGMPGRS